MNTATWALSIRPAVPVCWRWTPTEWTPFFRSPVSSTTRTPSGSPSWSNHDLPYVVADSVGVPFCPVQQPLHPVRAVMPDILGQLPARLDLEVGEQTGNELSRRAPGLDPGEPAREPVEYQG